MFLFLFAYVHIAIYKFLTPSSGHTPLRLINSIFFSLNFRLGSSPWRVLFLEVFLKSLSLFHCVPLYVCRLCINFQDLCARLLGMAALRILLLIFISRFVIDFLSIRKVIIFSAIATDDRHPLRSRSIHQNAANCMTIRFRYIAQPREVRKTYCAPTLLYHAE